MKRKELTMIKGFITKIRRARIIFIDEQAQEMMLVEEKINLWRVAMCKRQYSQIALSFIKKASVRKMISNTGKD